MSEIGPCRTQYPFKFETRHHIGVIVEMKGLIPRGIKGFKPGGKNHRAHIYGGGFLFFFKVYGIGGTKLFAGAAFSFLKIDTSFPVDDVIKGNGLGIGDIDGFSL